MTRVKICGITNVADALCAAEAGADFLGFIFYPPSSRCVTPRIACQIIETVRASSHPDVFFVGVFVDEEADAVRRILNLCGLNYAQLHGSESPEIVSALMGNGVSVIKAFRVRAGSILSDMERYDAAGYLLDTYVTGQPGGTGQIFDWDLAVQAKRHGPILLAGGLTPENVADAVRTVRPWGVDTASGVEAEPGRKDHTRVRSFVKAVKK